MSIGAIVAIMLLIPSVCAGMAYLYVRIRG